MRKFLKRLGIFAIIMVIIYILLRIFVSSAFEENLEINNYKIQSSKIDKAIRIVQVSDLHSYEFGKDNEELLASIKKQKPDLIFITGDLMEEAATFRSTDNFLKKVVKIAPSYYVTGNHEYNDNKLEMILKTIDDYDITRLSDESIETQVNGNEIIIGGLNDPNGDYYEGVNNTISDRLSNMKTGKNKLNILLSHRPELVNAYRKSDFALVFSGHAHGGQVRIPNILNGVVAPNQGFLPKYTKGVYELDANTNMVVSAGLVVYDKRPRFFNKPDLVVVDIVNK